MSGKRYPEEFKVEAVSRSSEASIVTPNRLQRQFNPAAPNERWATDIMYIRTREGWRFHLISVM